MSESPAVVGASHLLRRIKAEYMEMPGLRLTTAQAGRLWGLDIATCRDVLERLIAERFLQRRPDGTFTRFTEGITVRTPGRIAKAG
jgi:hypothetical protein